MRCQRGGCGAGGQDAAPTEDAVPAVHQLQVQALQWLYPYLHQPEKNGDESIRVLSIHIPPSPQHTSSCSGPADTAPTELLLTLKPGDNSALAVVCALCCLLVLGTLT